MTRLIILAAISLAVVTTVLVWEQLRKSPDLTAHDPGSDYDRYVLANAHTRMSLDPYRNRGVL